MACRRQANIAGGSRSLHQGEERLSFFDDIGGELARGVATDVLRRMDGSGRDEEHVAGLERHRRLSLDLIFQRAGEDIDDLFARMRVVAEGHSRVEVDAYLDGLASGDTEIVPLQVGTLDSGLLGRRHLQRQNASDDQRRHRHDSHRLHVMIAHNGSSLPACSLTMYSAYQSGQFASCCPPVRFSCSPCAAAARRRAPASSADEVNVVSLASTRPGNRAVTSWNSQPLPSGSLNEANV